MSKNGFCRRIYNSLGDFAEHTSAHGIPRAWNSHGLKKCLWLLLFFFCFVAFIFQASQIVLRFMRNDKIVGVELKFENIPFPSVTVCNLNPYKNSLARSMGSVRDTLLAFDDAIERSGDGRHRVRRSEPSSEASMREARQIHRVYEKMYSKYEGLLAVYSMCSCANNNCKALKDSKNGTLCLCFFNRKNDQIWPCYKPEAWKEQRCRKCTALGDCEYTEEPGQIPCLCAPLIRMCVRIEEEPVLQADAGADNDLKNDELPKPSTNASTLYQRIPKIWEIATTESPISIETLVKKEEAYGLKGVRDSVAIRTKATENLVFAVSSLSKEQKNSMSYSKRELITKCSFNGKPCSVERDFTEYIDPSYGNCFTFNHNTSRGIRIERAGPQYGLRFQVFVNISDYLPTTEAAGVRLTVHSPEEQPFPDTHGYSAPTGFVSSFGIRLKRVHRLPAPYGNCVEEGKDDDYIFRDKEYSTETNVAAAIRAFRRTEATQTVPSITHYYATAYEEHSSKRGEIILAWPAGAASLRSECDASLSAGECLQFHREQGAMVEVFYEQLNYESLQESEAYALPNLLSDFGGLASLWMGVSMITLIEVGILFSELTLGVFGTIFCCFCCRSDKEMDVEKEVKDAKTNRRRVRRVGPPPYHYGAGYDVVRSIR
ncbi:CBN-ASIC-1 protein [Aphelenchoides avenae]|nr:CBN-ASIC-1 protein [Aphelenchus avenae]